MKKLNWQDAVDFCRNLEFAGHSDWRLPTRTELESLIDISQHHPALPEGHPLLNTHANVYWSSSSYAGNPIYAWVVYMDVGYVDINDKTDTVYVWPVCNGQFDASGVLVIPGLQEGQERFIDNQDGTVTDNTTGLMWIKDLDSF
jgi:Protein of unknown function (DUF1566)